MASNADIGHGAKFGIAPSGGSTYTYVAEVTSITPPGGTRDTVEVTHLESEDGYKEYIGALKDMGEASITVNYVPATSDALLAAFEEDGTQDFRILYPSGTVALDFAGIVTGWELGDIVADDKMSATLTVKATGKPALTTVGA
jgi:predicted secreted protein